MRGATILASIVALAAALPGGGLAIPVLFAAFATGAASVRQLIHLRRGSRCQIAAETGRVRRFFSGSP